MQLTGKVAIITGAAQGVGRACVERLAAEGAKVVIADVADAAGNRAAKELTAQGLAVRYVHANVAERLDIHNLLTVTREVYGSIDILVTSASVIEHVPFLELDEATFDRTLGFNLKATFLCSQAAARQMIRQIAEEGRPPGSIVAISSPSPGSGVPESVAYAASRGATSQLVKSVASALAEHGIRINAVAPNTAGTAMPAGSPDNAGNRIDPTFTHKWPGRPSVRRMENLGEAEKITEIVAWLVSDEAQNVTGQTIFSGGDCAALEEPGPTQAA